MKITAGNTVFALDQNFCEFLAYEICKALEHSDNAKIKGFWYDGVLLNQPDNAYSQSRKTLPVIL